MQLGFFQQGEERGVVAVSAEPATAHSVGRTLRELVESAATIRIASRESLMTSRIGFGGIARARPS